MEIQDENLVTAPGYSDPQVPKVRSEQAGSCQSSSNDRRDTGVASQAPVILPATSAETVDHPPSTGGSIGNLSSSMSFLKSQIIGQ